MTGIEVTGTVYQSFNGLIEHPLMVFTVISVNDERVWKESSLASNEVCKSSTSVMRWVCCRSDLPFNEVCKPLTSLIMCECEALALPSSVWTVSALLSNAD